LLFVLFVAGLAALIGAALAGAAKARGSGALAAGCGLRVWRSGFEASSTSWVSPVFDWPFGSRHAVFELDVAADCELADDGVPAARHWSPDVAADCAAASPDQVAVMRTAARVDGLRDAVRRAFNMVDPSGEAEILVVAGSLLSFVRPRSERGDPPWINTCRDISSGFAGLFRKSLRNR
jgi:hypothetical protein